MTSITFGNNATAGTLTSFTNNGANSAGQTAGLTSFTDTASAASATIVNNGSTIAGGSPAATQFYDSSTADQANITNNGSNISGGFGAVTIFSGNATAANSVLTNNGGFGGGLGSSTMFVDNSTGALARGIARGNGNIDISGLTTTGMEIGSIEGNGNFFLGSKALTVGSNGLGTLVTGVIQDGGQAGGAGGSLVKEGVSTTNLSAPNSYTGGTIIRAGTLLVSNIRGSGTGTGSVTVIRGVLGGTGTISGLVTVGPGMGQGAVLAPGNQGVGTLTLTKMLTFSTNSFLRYEVQLDTAQADQVNAAGVTIDAGAMFVFNSIRTGTLTTGTVFTVINNTSSSAIVGRFGNLRDNGVFRSGATKFRASYEGGDGNDLTITVL
ncbi:MAG: autotransporter-associated beta strand repeat-containing protein [Chthoniobacterales bacterium]|nr:autotransporter-associated beta strand repeat-containing protein [Chthoniobacterales bacterium]